jgi:hypothetical protein
MVLPSVRAALQNKYGLAPWCWDRVAGPHPNLTRMGLTSPPTLAPGQVPLLAVSDTCASLWSLEPEPDTSTDPNTRGLAAAAADAWRTAADSLGVLPVVLRPDLDVRSIAVRARLIVADARPGHQATLGSDVGALDGRSFGLAFLAAQVGLTLDIALPADVAMTAQVTSRGAVVRVDYLAEKIGLLHRYAPGIRLLVVARSQRDDAQGLAAGTGIQVESAATASEALELLWPNLVDRFVAFGALPEQRQTLITRLASLAFGRRGSLHDWSPVYRTAERALECWPLSPEEQRRLRTVQSIALRHESNRGYLTLPAEGEDWHAQMVEPRRTEYVAQVVQQCADAGTPDPDAVLAFAADALKVRGRSAFPAHLMVLGAVSRLHAARASLQEAIAFSREATQAWLDRDMPDQASHPLTVWLRLAPLAGESELRAAQVALATVKAHVDAIGACYLALAEARSLLMLDDHDRAEALLKPLLDPGGNVPHHVRHSAARWVLRYEGEATLRKAAHDLLNEHETPESDPQLAPRWASARRFRLLSQLDAAVDQGDPEQCRLLLRAFCEAEAQPAGLVLATSSQAGAVDRAAWLTRWYPY